MIFIHNNSENPWTLVPFLTGKGTNNVKVTKQYDVDAETGEKGKNFGRVSLVTDGKIWADAVHDGPVIIDEINSSGVAKIADTGLMVTFTRKRLDPYVIIRNYDSDKVIRVLLASIPLDGGKLISVENSSTFTLDAAESTDEVSIAFSFANSNSRTVVYVETADGNSIISHTYSVGDSGDIVYRLDLIDSNTDRAKKIHKYKLKKFKPNSPTHVIMVREEHHSALANGHPSIRSNELVPYTESNKVDKIKEIRTQRYTVVTLYIDTLCEDGKRQEAVASYNDIKKLLRSNFEAVHILYKDGKVYKFKQH